MVTEDGKPDGVHGTFFRVVSRIRNLSFGRSLQHDRTAFDLFAGIVILVRHEQVGIVTLDPPDESLTCIACTAGRTGDIHRDFFLPVKQLGLVAAGIGHDDTVAAVALVACCIFRQRQQVLVEVVCNNRAMRWPIVFGSPEV